MKIESLRLDFLTLIIHINITKAQNISEHIREGRKNKNKNQKNPGHRARPKQRAAQVARGPGSMLPRSRATWAAHNVWVARRPGPRVTPGSRSDLRQRTRPTQRAAQAVATAKVFWRFCFLSFAFFYLAFCLAAQKI